MATEFGSSRKKRDVKDVVRAYFVQLTDGCGAVECSNEFCVSSAKCQRRTPDEAASFAVQLARRKARVCYKGAIAGASPPLQCPVVQGLEEEDLIALVETCKSTNNKVGLVRRIGQIFSSVEHLSASFLQGNTQKPRPGPVTAGESSVGDDFASTEKREDTPAAAGPLDSTYSHRISVNLPSLRRSYKAIMALDDNDSSLESSFHHAVVSVIESLSLPSAFKSGKLAHSPLNAIISILELPFLQNPLFLESALPPLVRLIARLPSDLRVILVHFFSTYDYANLKQLVTILHQFIAFTIAMEDYTPRGHRRVNDDISVRCAVSVMEIIFTAAVTGGEHSHQPEWLQSLTSGSEETTMAVDQPSSAASAPSSAGPSRSSSGQSRRNRHGPISPLREIMNAMMRGLSQGDDIDHHVQGQRLLDILEVDLRYCRKPIVPFEEFYSEPLSAALDFAHDYMAYRAHDDLNEFSFLSHPYILAPSLKVQALAVDNSLRMRHERRQMLLLLHMGQNLHDSFLRLRVRRDHLIIDTLALLEAQCADDPHNLKKQLFVEFEGEQGIDEGGVQKEFFQLMIEQLFNPDFGMFIWDDDTRFFWFNPTSFEQESQYTLIGMLLGLAIYNNCILDIHFPSVVYRKLMGVKGTLDDLKESHPVIANSLQQMLEHDGDNFEDVFDCTFTMSHTDIFGQVLTHELKENGAEIVVNKANRQEYVNLYCDYLLNKMVKTQFEAFRKGFMLVTDDSPLSDLFLPGELQLLICGIDHLDMKELESGTHYDGGYTRDTPVIRFFWETVYGFTDEQKRQLLAFCTGSDRVPVGGLEQLHFIIAKNGGDSDRLPTAHTCFNVLLLPDYKTKERLADRLIKAITHAKGFGLM